MKVTGYKLREALRRWQLRRDAASGQFKDSLNAFPGENKPKPEDLAAAVLTAERAIAELQAGQAQYNMTVRVTVDGASLSLLQCIKQVGGIERAVAMWSDAAKLKKDKYSFVRDDAGLRGADKVAAQRTISYEDAAKHAAQHDRTRAAYVEAMAVGNASEISIDLSPALFE
jgi:hypothetical protein